MDNFFEKRGIPKKDLRTIEFDSSVKFITEDGLKKFIYQGDQVFYVLTGDDEKQFVISKLAELVMPVAEIIKCRFEGNEYFCSRDVSNYSKEYKNEKVENLANEFFLSSVFFNHDHSVSDGGHNFKDGIFFDFKRVEFFPQNEEEYVDYIDFYFTVDLREEYNEDELDSVFKRLNEKVSSFLVWLRSDESQNYINSLYASVDFTEITEDELRTVLINRSVFLIKYLSESCIKK